MKTDLGNAKDENRLSDLHGFEAYLDIAGIKFGADFDGHRGF